MAKSTNIFIVSQSNIMNTPSLNNLIVLNSTQFPVKLTASNYFSWKAQFDSLLFRYDLLSFINGTKSCPSAEVLIDEKAIPYPDFILWQRAKFFSIVLFPSSQNQ